MNHQAPIHLHKELTAAGASAGEADELLAVASQLKRLSPAAAASSRPRRRLRLFVPFGLSAVSGLTLGMALVIFSQTVLPGSWLYPVQALSDNVASSVDASYKGTVMMKRAEQVKQLVATHASSAQVLATLADYKTEAAQYKAAATNYAAFEYCKTSLEQAAALAPDHERQAIVATLSSLATV